MTFYYIIVVLCIASLFLKEKIGKFIGWGVFFLMAYMTMFRGNYVGTDTMNYLVYDAEHRIEEYFITALSYLIYTGTISERGIIYGTCVVTYLFAFLNIKKYKLDVRYFCVFFFIYGFFAMGMNISRQVASVSLLVYFLPYIFNDKWEKSLLFFLGCFLAAGFHISSLFLVYLYVLRFIHFKENNIPIIIFFFGTLILFDIFPIDYFLNAFMPETYAESYETEVSQEMQISLVGFVYRIILLGVYVYFSKYLLNRKDFCLFVFSAIIINAVIGMNPDVARIFNINSYALLIFSCFVYTHRNMRKDGVLKILFFVQLFLGLYMTLFSFQNNPDLCNYEFV